jgi:PilZ domain-containing protein
MGSNEYGGPERRKYFRVEYPPDEGPKLIIRSHKMDVLNVSERGICFVNHKKVKLAKSLSGKLEFRDGESFTVEAKVVWKKDDMVGVRLIIPIPYARIIKEQRYLLMFK